MLFGNDHEDNNITVADVYDALNKTNMTDVFADIMYCFDSVNALGKKWLLHFPAKPNKKPMW